MANFPLPVITGIGHDRDESVLDMVANMRVKTPTAAAALLISRLKATADRITACQDAIARTVARKMETEHIRIARLAERIPSLFSVAKTRHEARLDIIARRMEAAAIRRVENGKNHIGRTEQMLRPLAVRLLTAERHRIDMLTQRAQALDPALLLRRGYSITLHEGRAVRNASLLKPGDILVTRLDKGTVTSVVDK